MRVSAIFFVFISLLLPGRTPAQDIVIVSDSLTRTQVIRNLVKQYPQWENTSHEHIVMEKFWQDVLRIQVLWGLNRDPVPAPFKYYTSPGGIIVANFMEVLQSSQYIPEDAGEALRLAVLIIRDNHRSTRPCLTKDDLDMIPKKLKKKHKPFPARAEALGKDGWMVTFYSWQTAQSHSFTRHARPEQLMKHTVISRDGTWEWIPETLHITP